jgi:hypothetical protein
MPRYHINEVFSDGTLHDTGKIVECPEYDSYNNNVGIIVRAVLSTYGFGHAYDSYYKYRAGNNGIMNIYYSYQEGDKNTWVLIPEDNETNGDENE